MPRPQRQAPLFAPLAVGTPQRRDQRLEQLRADRLLGRRLRGKRVDLAGDRRQCVGQIAATSGERLFPGGKAGRAAASASGAERGERHQRRGQLAAEPRPHPQS